MLNKKLIYIFVVLVAGLFVISACSSLINQDGVGARIRQGDNSIKANSCDADNTCEMSSAKMGSLILENSKISTKRGNDLILESGSGNVQIRGNLDLNVDENEIGNAYLCVNSEGVVYRSSDGCV